MRKSRNTPIFFPKCSAEGCSSPLLRQKSVQRAFRQKVTPRLDRGGCLRVSKNLLAQKRLRLPLTRVSEAQSQ